MISRGFSFPLYSLPMHLPFLQKEWAWWLTGLALLTLAVYALALNNLFIPFDDNTLIYMNAAVAQLSFASLIHVFTSYDPELYIPLTFVAYQIIHLFAGFNPAAYHAVSLLLHVLNTGLVIWCIWQLTQRRSIALIVGALFALHPLQSETVLWAAALKDVLSGTFALLSINFYLHYKSTSASSAFRWCLIFFVLGLLAKVSIVLLPVLFLLIDWQYHSLTKKAVTEKWTLYFFALLFIFVAIAGKTAVIGGAGLMASLLLPFKATAFYLLKIIWPIDLSLLYPESLPFNVTQPALFISSVTVIALLIIAFTLRNRARIIAAGILWYLILLAPSFSTFYKNEFLYFASNRYAYLPSIGIFLIVAVIAVSLWDRIKGLRIPIAVLGSASLIGCVFIVHQQVIIWHDPASLFSNVLRIYPDSAVANNNLASTYKNGPEALPLLQKAVSLEPSFILGYRNIATYYRTNNQLDAMKQTYEFALSKLLEKPQTTTDDLSLLYDYAEYKDETGDHTGTIELLQKAIDLHPEFSESYYNLGVKYEKYNQLADALAALQKAFALNSSDPDTLYHLAAVDAQTGKLAEAAELLERLILINPTYEKAQTHLANIRKMLSQ